ncbi:NUDIX hydrolase [Nitrososphaera viennensis]|uniref:CoA pyrophosphatase n=1 Tax=Nitrososphaera viennensis TaxID=1034015 RepID=A0A977IDF2_9ARCH|nr:CoA pyrophosphatase [Nitrososphaera viennensis]UVS68756.1 CoA pyrophosphatase [Nitrososphaera viennensis]
MSTYRRKRWAATASDPFSPLFLASYTSFSVTEFNQRAQRNVVQKEELLQRLAGALANKKSVHMPQDAATSIPSAVLVIIHYHHGGVPHVFLTKRSAGLKSHGSEISFPGGRHAEGDATLLETALRETQEEVGIVFSPKDIAGSLQVVRTMTSNHYIVPFVTVQDMLPRYRVSAHEVEEVLDAPLIETLETMEPDTEHFHLSKNAYRFTYRGNVIWGATARIMIQLHSALIRPS